MIKYRINFLYSPDAEVMQFYQFAMLINPPGHYGNTKANQIGLRVGLVL